MAERVSTALLRRTIEYLETHPEEHDQTDWAVRESCGTTMCIAGTAVVLAGMAIDWDGGFVEFADILYGNEEVLYACRTVEGKYIADTARDLLDFSQDEAKAVFYCMKNDLALTRAREILAKREAKG